MNKTKTKNQAASTEAKHSKTSAPTNPPSTRKSRKSPADREAVDRLPATSGELQQTKGGFVAFHFLTGKDKDAIAQDLASAFKLADAQAIKITRRITARVRLYQRIFELIPLKN